MATSDKRNHPSLLNAAVIVAALGYFVDIYDLVLFSIVRTPSLTALGVTGDALSTTGLFLINCQMFGMLLGGIFWGVMGDKRGRLAVLFGSILLYSLANIANGLVTDVTAYAVLRFVAGIGLAGELGAGITLVAEILPKEKRGYGTTIVASIGVCGAVLAAQIAEAFDWRVAYHIGGGLGILLLLLRISVFESGLFAKLSAKPEVSRGNFLGLFRSRKRFFKYLGCILVGLPTWFVIGILVTFAPEFAKALGVEGAVTGGRAIMFAYMGLAVGDLSSGLLSQWLRSRRKVIVVFMMLTLISNALYLHLGAWAALTPDSVYLACLMMGFGVGFWCVFVTIGAEQFGTNLRATVATTVPNFARGSLNLISLVFAWGKAQVGILPAAQMVSVACVAISLLAVKGLHETFHKELDYFEL